MKALMWNYLDNGFIKNQNPSWVYLEDQRILSVIFQMKQMYIKKKIKCYYEHLESETTELHRIPVKRNYTKSPHSVYLLMLMNSS